MPLPKDLSAYLRDLVEELGLRARQIIPLKGDGSERKFFRVKTPKESYILVLPQPGEFGLKEARAYYLLGRFFRRYGVPVPEILTYRSQDGVILLEDLGEIRLCEYDHKEALYPEAVRLLSKLQALAPFFPREAVLETLRYDQDLIWQKEVLYFETWYLKRYRKKAWSPEERALWRQFVEESVAYFTDTVVLHRDFQSRNLMVRDRRLYLIDFQAARLGPPSYDLASLGWDPYVEKIPREGLLNFYLRLTGRPAETFLEEWKRLSVFRLMQALGAFVKLSLRGKSWFKTYIPRAEKRLKHLLPRSLKDTL